MLFSLKEKGQSCVEIALLLFFIAIFLFAVYNIIANASGQMPYMDFSNGKMRWINPK